MHPLSHRLKEQNDHHLFNRRWLVDLKEADLSLPAYAIINGWMAYIESNQWFQDELKGKVNIFSYEARGTGKSPKNGRLDPVQYAIDADRIIGEAFKEYDQLAKEQGITPGSKIIQANCMGTLPLATMFAAKLPLSRKVDGVVLLSPVSTFNLPWKIKFGFFVPPLLAKVLRRYVAPIVVRKIAPKEESERSRQESLKRLNSIDLGVAGKQAREVLWKADVTPFWKTIKVPALILVSDSDPLVRLEESVEVYHRLPFPIWMQMTAPDHLILEDNIDKVKVFLPEFAANPWNFYEKNKHRKPM
ncbi:MAG: hypothetical protein D6732_07460 [Methanobacteriota archaeon]|nr:MAG: hypothetical protein D6732_07460 [Euryarchaeota archaeon]